MGAGAPPWSGPQQRLYFAPEQQGHASFGPCFAMAREIGPRPVDRDVLSLSRNARREERPTGAGHPRPAGAGDAPQEDSRMVDSIRPEPSPTPTTHSLRELIGAKVKDLTLADLGHVDDLIIDGSTGRVTYAILAFGGLLGIGEKRFPVPWETLHWRAGDRAFVLQHHGKVRDDLRDAPHVTPSHEHEDRGRHLRELIDQQLAPAVHSFYPGGPGARG